MGKSTSKTKKATKSNTAVCPICGKKFTKKVNNQTYCSAKCKKVAKAAADKKRRAAKKNLTKKTKSNVLVNSCKCTKVPGQHVENAPIATDVVLQAKVIKLFETLNSYSRAIIGEIDSILKRL